MIRTRSKIVPRTTFPDGLVHLTRDMLIDPIKKQLNNNSSFESLIENQDRLSFNGTTVSINFGGWVATAANLTTAGVGDEWLVTDDATVYTYNGSTWDAGEIFKMHVYSFGLSSWTPPYIDVDLGKLHNITGLYGFFVQKPFNISGGYSNPVIKIGS